jgi:hypothetical protein
MNTRDKKLSAEMVALVEKLWNENHAEIILHGEKPDFIIVPLKRKEDEMHHK